jgi:hypothetical protein
MDGIAVMAYLDGIGGGPVQPSLEGIEQVNIDLAGTQAEFARAANFTVVSKSGTNELHGGAFSDYNGNQLNARNFFLATVPFRVFHNFGASVGGPIRKNKTFYFADYEGAREAATAVIAANTPLAPGAPGILAPASLKRLLTRPRGSRSRTDRFPPTASVLLLKRHRASSFRCPISDRPICNPAIGGVSGRAKPATLISTLWTAASTTISRQRI